MTERDNDSPSSRSERVPLNHRTIDRVISIIEQVVYSPGMTFSEIVRASGAAKSSVYGFVSGLLAKGWLYEDQHRFYLGPAAYGLTLASGHIRAGVVTHADLLALHEETGLVVFLGVQAGDHLIYISEAGSDNVEGFEARSNIRRTLLDTAGGKVLLADRSRASLEVFLRRREPSEAEMVERFLAEYEEIAKTGIATNVRRKGTRFAIATAVRNRSGEAVASVTLVGPTPEVQPRLAELSDRLIGHVNSWSKRQTSPREAI